MAKQRVGFATREVADLLGLRPWQIRSFVADGVLHPTRQPGRWFCFSFQDLVVLKAAQRLLKKEVRGARVRRFLRTVHDQLAAEQSLAGVGISWDHDLPVVQDERMKWNPMTGQILLDFEADTHSVQSAKISPLERSKSPTVEDRRQVFTAKAWFGLARDLEDVAPEEARQAYRRALECNPSHVDAHINLGRLLHEEGLLTDAESHYRQALRSDPRHGTAAFNLAIVLEDQNRRAEAISSYHLAVEIEPDNAEAHFNLAKIYEEIGDRASAIQHLRDYQRLKQTN